MYSYKSSPIIEENTNPVKRSSKNSSTHRDSNEYENHKVPNPFLMGQNTMLPPELHQQIQNLEYLSPHQLEKISWAQAVSVPRRSSVFTRHLDAMQRAAREQQQKVGAPKRNKVCFKDQMEIEEQISISLDEECEDDLISRDDRQRWALQPFEIQQESQLFVENNNGGNRHIEFYSMTELSNINNDWDDYFNV